MQSDLVLQRLSDTLAQLHTELVQVRQQRQRALADAFEGVNEEGWNINAAAGTVTTPATLMTVPVLIKRVWLYVSTTTASLQWTPTGPKIPLGTAGVYSWTVERLYQPGQRPQLTDTSGTSTIYIYVSGHALPSAAQAL